MDGENPFGIAVTRAWPLVSLATIVTAVTLLSSLGTGSLGRTVTTMLINLILVVSLYTFTGLSGIFSIGHLGFMAVGAYTQALLSIPVETKEGLPDPLLSFLTGAHLPTIPATLVAGALAAFFAFVVAIPLMRISGLTAALGTFTVLVVVNVVAKNWQAVTQGTSGLPGIPATTTKESALIWALTAMTAAYLFQESSFGLRLRASREDEIAAQAGGVRVSRERGIAFVVSGFLSGVAGALFATHVTAFGPDAFFLQLTFLTLIMLVIGGMKSLAGAVVGTVVVSAVSEFLRRAEQGIDFGPFFVSAPTGLRELGLAVILLLILILRPSGLMGGHEIHWPFTSRRL